MNQGAKQTVVVLHWKQKTDLAEKSMGGCPTWPEGTLARERKKKRVGPSCKGREKVPVKVRT